MHNKWEKKLNVNDTINYVELPSKNIEDTKSFFINVFGWSFQDFGPEYTSFNDQGIDGGFYKSSLNSTSDRGAALIVFYSDNIEDTKEKIEKALKSISEKKGWLQDPQRFPVIISYDDEAVKDLFRLGGQVDVVVYTGDNFFLNGIAAFRLRLISLLSYVR